MYAIGMLMDESTLNFNYHDYTPANNADLLEFKKK
jgi:hypothetical protein